MHYTQSAWDPITENGSSFRSHIYTMYYTQSTWDPITENGNSFRSHIMSITSATRSLESPSMSLKVKQLDGFRVWATEDMLDNRLYWFVKDIKLYSNLDCTGTNYNDETPVSSQYYEYYGPEYAFDSNDFTWWVVNATIITHIITTTNIGKEWDMITQEKCYASPTSTKDHIPTAIITELRSSKSKEDKCHLACGRR